MLFLLFPTKIMRVKMKFNIKFRDVWEVSWEIRPPAYSPRSILTCRPSFAATCIIWRQWRAL